VRADSARLAALAAERRYPAFTASDDDFHDEVMSDRWWETETSWFSWSVPERRLAGWAYHQSRPNAGLCNGGVWVWDGTGAWSWELPYHAHYSGLRLHPRADRDLRDYTWPTGVRVRTLAPLTRYAVDYDAQPDLEVHLEFDAIMAPNPHPVGVAPFVKGTHFDQPGHVTGTMVLRGEHIAIDCYAVRDRSWGPRPAGPPRRRPPATGAAGAPPAPARPRTGGIGYCFGTAGPRDAWLTYSVPDLDGDPVVCGFFLRDGEYAHVLAGERRVLVDAETGWPVRIDVEAVDDLGRELSVTGDALSRHWRGLGGDTLMAWRWNGAEGVGEDQSYFSKPVWLANRTRAQSR